MQRKTSSTLQDFVRSMPKVELHLHLEGTLEPGLLLQLAHRNHVPLKYNSVQEVRKSYEFHDLQSFFEVYYENMSVLRNEQDFYDLTWQYLSRARKEVIRHAEVFFDPQPHMERGVLFDTIVHGIYRALEDGFRYYGISTRLICCFVSHFSEEDALRTFHLALDHKDKIAGFGLDSSEMDNHPEKFAYVFARAHQEGFLLVAHAGEAGPSSYIQCALDELYVDRIDNGIRCVDDPALMDRLMEEEIPLTICPLSNVKLGLFPSMSHHNIKYLLRKGLRATVNSDDPAYFGGYITENYLALVQDAGINRDDVVQLAKNAIQASSLPLGSKRALQSDFDSFVQKHRVERR